ncbi:MAG TPA: hypothetical protein IAD32_00445 [Candidatus Scatavimonas merdigallinarum]|mgnify:CR=1|uniref:Uncharacterized protein n=1 Tax=Candidatus Scatavimonas merdigallinarum TaxID=2840914 RepID=A0A9D0ZFY0_9FIRM|nr:hypothetical protein [Candidatus Scatavimonas merdigallinarum]
MMFCLVFILAGRSKDFILDGFNDLLHHASQYALTDEKALQGERMKGVDTYTVLIQPNTMASTALNIFSVVLG